MTIRSRLFKLERVHKVATNCGACDWPLDGTSGAAAAIAAGGPVEVDPAEFGLVE